MTKIALLGFGVVGGGVARLLTDNAKSVENACGGLELARIFVRREFNSPFAPLMTRSIDEIIADEQIKIVVEAMGGLAPAFNFAERTIRAGKAFVTSNKELISEKGDLLLSLAEKYNVPCLFEGAVGGAVPIIRPLHTCLAANKIHRISGILNGTTNFILTKMIDEGTYYSEALRLAQSLGYAEGDPTADVEGIDAARKLSILASIICGRKVLPCAIETRGISGVTAANVAEAEKRGCVIKLIARAEFSRGGAVKASVSPAFVPKEHPLSAVKGVHNALYLNCDAAGEVMLFGRGAGALPTASAVLSDAIDAAKSFSFDKTLFWTGQSADVSGFNANGIPFIEEI